MTAPSTPSSTALAGLAEHRLQRRTLLRGVFLGLGVAAMPGFVRTAWAQNGPNANELQLPVGPLANVPPLEKKILTSGALPGIDDRLYAPVGFDVRCVARKGLNPVTMAADDGYLWHIDPDGGAVFPSPEDGGWVYACNSEETPGGVGALRFDADGNKIDAYRILDNTRNNCAGGATPWGTWLSCEETSGGYVYECDPFGSVADAVRKPALGALNHEACAIDPINHVCYETEDGGSQRFYRFVSAPEDLSEMPDGTVRMGLELGELQIAVVEGFEDGANPSAEDLREPRRVNWVAAAATSALPGLPFGGIGGSTPGTYFASAEGIWYYEVPEDLRSIPVDGDVPTRGVMFFATKGDNRVYAYDIENQLIEIIFDNENSQQMSYIDVDGNLQPGRPFNQVDNVVVSPAGDVLVAEDGTEMRLMVVVPNDQPRLLMQITGGGSEITGPAFSADGSRLYFNSQRGPDGEGGNGGATYEMLIPEEYRVAPPLPFSFPEYTGVRAGSTVTSSQVTLTGMTGIATIRITSGELRVNNGAYSSQPQQVDSGDHIRVRHIAASDPSTRKTSVISVAGFSTEFTSVTLGEDRDPDAFDFGRRDNVEASTEVISEAVVLSGFTDAAVIRPQVGASYSLNGAPFTSAEGSALPGDSLVARHVSSDRSLGYRKTAIDVGGQRGYFVTRTKQF